MFRNAFYSLLTVSTVICLFIFSNNIDVYGSSKSNDLEEKVKAEIPYYYEKPFTVSVIGNNTVKIEGKVNTLYDKYKIYNIIAKVPGVHSIINQLVVDTPPMPDEMIRSNIIQEKNLVSSILEPDRIIVRVENGIVFLDGFVSYHREKTMMKTLTSWQKGVKGIVNNIEVLPPEAAKSDVNIKMILDQIMDHEFPIEDEVKYTVNEGVVTLTGLVSSIWVKNQIPEKFENVLGIKEVENHLNIQSDY